MKKENEILGYLIIVFQQYVAFTEKDINIHQNGFLFIYISILEKRVH